MLKGLLKVSGMLVLKLVYGSQYEEKAYDRIWLMLLLSMVNIFWLLCILFLIAGIAAKDTVLCAVFVITYPVIIAIWSAVERKKV